MKYFLIANSALLVALTVCLSYLIISLINLKSLILTGINRLNHEYTEARLRIEVKKYTRGISIKMSLPEKVELYLIDKSNIRRYIPFFNFYVLCFISLSIFASTFGPVYRVLFFVPSTVVICVVFSHMPVLLLDLMGRYNSEKIRRLLAEFISVLKSYYDIKEDIFFAFERSLDSEIGEPLKTFIRDMVIQVRNGMPPTDALDILSVKVDNEQFKELVLNIKQNIKHRGDTSRLLSNIEDQFYKIEEEYNRRKISTFNDRLLVYVVMFAVLVIGYYFLKVDTKVAQFYLGTTQGKYLLAFFSILYTAGFYLTTRISKFNY